MKVLFISSGFTGIYPFFEDSIVAAFITLNHSIHKIAPKYTNETIEWIERFNPDFVLTFVGYKTDDQLLQLLKKNGAALGVWLTEDPYYIDQSILLIEKYDYIFTIDLGAYEFYKRKFPAKNIHHLPLGSDPSLYYPSNSLIQDSLYDLCLVGYPYPNRIDLINHILDQTSHTILLAGPNWKKYFNNKTDRLMILNQWMEPGVVSKIFSYSKIVLNPHRPFNFNKNQNSLGIESRSINNRTFDIAASGEFQLIENKLDLSQHFDTSQEIVPYGDFNECVHLIKQFVDDEQSRNFYKQNAREKLLKSHTFVHRVELLLKQISEN